VLSAPISGPFDPLFLFAPLALGAIVVLLSLSRAEVLARSAGCSKGRFLWFWFLLNTGVGYLIIFQEQLGTVLHWQSAWILLIVLFVLGVTWQFWRGRNQGTNQNRD
jgi:hypothetical protein